MREHKVVDQFTVRREPTIERMHQKALTGDDFVISGSMNFTFSGVMLNKEHVQFQTDQVSVAAAQMDLQKQFGGRLK